MRAEIDLQLNNGLITTPAMVLISERMMDWSSVDITIYTRDIAHQIAVGLVGSTLQLVVRSPLGTTPEMRTLYDFGDAVSENAK